MFSQVFVILSLNRGGEGGGQHQWSTTSPSGTRSEHLPPPDQVRTSTPLPPGPGQNIYPPEPGQNIYPPDQVRTSTPLPPGPGQNIYPLPPEPGQNIYPPDQVRTSTPPGPGQNIYPLPPRLHAGGRYASYWNAFLFYPTNYTNWKENL